MIGPGHRRWAFSRSGPRSGPRSRWAIAWVLAIVVLSFVAPAFADEPARKDDKTSKYLNWAFANRLGSGIYNIAGRTVQVYKIPVTVKLRDMEDHAFGIKLKFPVTFGFYDFSPEDLIGGKLPDDVNTITFAPGVEFWVPLSEHWTLIPLAEIGFGHAFEDSQTVGLFTLGVMARASYPAGPYTLRIGQDLIYAGQTETRSVADDFASYEAGFEALRPLGAKIKGHPLDYGLFATGFFYFDTLQFGLPEGGSIDVDYQFEVGVTFGTIEKVKLWKIKLPRIGLSWRFGDGLSTIRLVLGKAF